MSEILHRARARGNLAEVQAQQAAKKAGANNNASVSLAKGQKEGITGVELRPDGTKKSLAERLGMVVKPKTKAGPLPEDPAAITVPLATLPTANVILPKNPTARIIDSSIKIPDEAPPGATATAGEPPAPADSSVGPEPAGQPPASPTPTPPAEGDDWPS